MPAPTLPSPAGHLAPGATLRATPAAAALFALVLGLVLLRLGLNATLLDRFINYRADEGNILEKIHPVLYGFAAVAMLCASAYRITLTDWETRVLRAMLAFIGGMVGLTVYLALRGTGIPVAFMIDNYGGACFSALLFLFPTRDRRLVGEATLLFFALSALVGTLEFATKLPVLPHDPAEVVFRPAGLSSHPLELGLWCAVSIPFVTLTGWSRSVKWLVGAVLFVGLAASSARTALMCGSAAALLVVVGAVQPRVFAQRRLERRLMVVIGALAVVPLLVGALFAAGALDRFNNGIVDDSASARVIVYQVFDYMSWPDILFGIGFGRLHDIAIVQLHLFAVESAVVLFVALFGLIGTLVFVALLLRLLAVLLQGARAATLLATVLFFAIALSNNALATKEPSLFALVLCIVAFRPEEGGAGRDAAPSRRGTRAQALLNPLPFG